MEFLKGQKRFSFRLNGVYSWDLPYEEQVTETDDELVSVYIFEKGLKVTNVAKKYKKYGAYEWVNYWENISTQPTGVISELWDGNFELPIEKEAPYQCLSYFPDVKTATKIYAPTGSRLEKKEFYTNVDEFFYNERINHIYPNWTRKYATYGGRSSQGHAPFFNVHKNGKGYIFAIGWTGQWNCEISRTEDTVIFRSKIEDTNFKLCPGEKFRTSSVVVMPYEGDYFESQNKWRRLLKENFSLIGRQGRDQYGPFCANLWGGMNTSAVLEQIRLIKENDLPFEYVWMDAGWYGITTKPSPDEFEGDWADHTGDWRVSPLIHPNLLQDVSQAVQDAGMKFLLWFEPERVKRGTPIVEEHSEYFFKDAEESNGDLLLNLGDEKAWQYCFDFISTQIEKLNLSFYRQDFNMDPLEYWRRADREDRKGISEIKHINGLYRLWDELLLKFPHLKIDNCASGGRRIDIETLRRSMPLWRSDHQCSANYDVEASQCHHLTFNTWMPYSGTGSGRACDEYRIRSSYDSSLGTSYFWSEKEASCNMSEKIAFIKKYGEEYVRLRPYFSEDFYPLTEYSENLDTWCASQFDRPERGDGIVQIFRRENAPYETATFYLRGLKDDTTYAFTDIDGGETSVLTGKEIAQNGWKITVNEKRKAKIYLYKAIEK